MRVSQPLSLLSRDSLQNCLNALASILRITKVGDEDNGKYSLLVKNSVGEAHLDSLLDVMGKPKPPKVVKEIEPKEVTVPGKKDLRLQCKISGFPMPTIKWMRDGNEIKVRGIMKIKVIPRMTSTIV